MYPNQGKGTFQKVRYGQDGKLSLSMDNTYNGSYTDKKTNEAKSFTSYTLCPEAALALANEIGKMASQGTAVSFSYFPEQRFSQKTQKHFISTNMKVSAFVPKTTAPKNYAPQAPAVDPQLRAQQVAASMGGVGPQGWNNGQG